jgi:hypothetical protein
LEKLKDQVNEEIENFALDAKKRRVKAARAKN